MWLSVDEVYNEYSLSWPANNIKGRIDSRWHEVDRGHQVVVSCSGDVDVERGDAADFVEHEDASEDNILSVEIWDDGTEYSKGYYVEPNNIRIIGYEKPKFNWWKFLGSGAGSFCICMIILVVAFILEYAPSFPKHINNYLKKSQNYEYVTSITGNEKQKADVYQYTGPKYYYTNTNTDENYFGNTTDEVAKDIINGIEGQTEYVTQEDDAKNASIAIVTSSEYCFIYHPEDDNSVVYIQISKRKYNYTSDNSLYRGSSNTNRWYRSHYYSSSYSSDSKKYSSTPSAYESYSGETIHDLGNGYYDSYSSSVRQSSINSRRSSSGGGK